MGYNTSPDIDTSFGFAYWHFGSGSPIIEYELDMLGSYQETNASICSKRGEVLIMTNGMEIFTPSGDRIVDTIAYLSGGENWDAFYSDVRNIPRGFPKIQTAIILPMPGDSNEYSIIYYHGVTHPELLFFGVVRVLEARVRRMTDGSWEVLYKDKTILTTGDFLSEGTWHACRHANGRDWWLPIHDFEGTSNYSLLLDAGGWQIAATQELIEMRNFSTNSWFSPNGSKYAKYVNTSGSVQYLYIYDFDRCSGLLHNQFEMRLEGEIMIYQGMAFSPNSRYLFVGVDAWDL
jgi:hypothetical protein